MPAVNAQGSLDGLCGVYSVMNAIAHLGGRKVNKEILSNIFLALAKEIEADGNLAESLVTGISFPTLRKLVDAASIRLQELRGLKLKRRTAFKTEPASLDEFWTSLKDHVGEFGAGSCILGLEGLHSHWTCVKSVSKSTVKLIDSNDLHVIHRSRSTVGYRTKLRHHELWATQTLFLEMKPIG